MSHFVNRYAGPIAFTEQGGGGPSLPDADTLCNAVLYTGNGTSQSITGVGFQPDVVWVKNRDSGAINHAFANSTRGSGRFLITNQDAGLTPEQVLSGSITSYDSDGFSVGSINNWNNASDDYASWCWREFAGYLDVVQYTGTGANRTVAHSLAETPTFMIVRSMSARNWRIYHGGLASPETQYLQFSNSNPTTDSTVWNDTAPTSTEFTVGTANEVNNSGETYIAVLFPTVSNYIDVGTYTGNGSTIGPQVTVGFTPKIILIKRSTGTASNWVIADDQRANAALFPDTVSNEATRNIDFLATGFQPRATNGDINASGATYTYVAWA